jgi:DNA-binding HxlR family transcriptional regulator
MELKKMPELGAEQALTLVSNKWFILVVHALMQGKLRYAELRRAIPAVSKKMLTQTLRTMERDGFVSKTVFPVVPPHTEYQLTELGESLVPPLQQLCRWSATHIDQVQEHRRKFDEMPTAAIS